MEQTLVRQVEKLEIERDLLTDKVFGLREQGKQLEMGIKEKQELIERLKKDLIAMQALKKDKSDELAELKNLRESLKKELEETQQRSEKALEREISRLLCEMSELELKKRNGLVELQDYKDSLKEKEDRLSDYEEELAKRTKELSEEERKLRNESSQLEIAREGLFSWESQLEDMEALLMTKEDKFKDYKQSTDESAREMGEALQQLKGAVAVWRSRVSSLRFFSNTLDKRQNAIDRIFMELDRKKQVLLDKERALKAARKDLENIKQNYE